MDAVYHETLFIFFCQVVTDIRIINHYLCCNTLFWEDRHETSIVFNFNRDNRVLRRLFNTNNLQ